MTIICSCAVVACGGGQCPVQSFLANMQALHGPLNPGNATDAERLRGLFFDHTGHHDQSRCHTCWPAVLDELQTIHVTGECRVEEVSRATA